MVESTWRQIMRYLSVCSGIEAASVAWESLGWTPVAFAEIEKFPSQVLAHRFPHVQNLGDMTKFTEWDKCIDRKAVDLIVGGTPCQAFSIAGLRKGRQIQEETCPSPSYQWLTTTAQSGLYGKMCPVFCQVTEDGILAPSSQRWGTSGMGTPTECLTLNTSESPSVAVESLLSHILQDLVDIQPKYYLSLRACEGILRRAEKRNKTLPSALRKALIQMVSKKQ